MKKLLLGLLLLISAPRAVDTLSVPTDFLSVTTGTRANLSGNFTAIQTWGNKVRDSIAQVTARVTGYSGSLAITSLSNLRLKLDGDNTETARLLVESGNGDSLFTVREDTTARFYRHLTVDSNLTVGKKLTVTDSIIYSPLTASRPALATDANKRIIPATTTGTGSTLVLSASPTVTGTLTAAGITASGATVVNNDLTVNSDNTSNTVWGLKLTTTSAGNGIQSLDNIRDFGSNIFRIRMRTAGTPVTGFQMDGGGTVTMLSVNASGLTTTGMIVAGDSIRGTSERLTGSLTTGSLTSGGTATLNNAVVNGTFAPGGAIDIAVYSKTTNATLDYTLSTVLADASTGSFTLTLPAAASSSGIVYTIIKNDASTNTVTIDGNASETVGGSLTQVLAGNSGTRVLKIICNGTSWNILQYLDEGTFTATLTGVTATVTGTARWTRIGQIVNIWFPNLTGTSNSANTLLTGIPATLYPSHDTYASALVQNNGTTLAGYILCNASNFTLMNGSTNLFTASGNKGLYAPTLATYTLQ